MYKILLSLLFVVSCSTIQAQKGSSWKRINPNEATDFANKNSKSNPENQLLFQLDEDALRQSLVNIQGKSVSKNGIEISIPNMNGDLERFLVLESSNFSPELQAKYPDIRAYTGIGITDRNASVNFSLSPNGIQTMVLRGDSGSEFIERYSKDNAKKVYVLFDAKNRERGTLPFSCKTQDVKINKQLLSKTSQLKANNGVFKTLRLALSCTGEYTTYHGGTVAGALEAMNATMARVNGVFNKDLALKLEIIASNNLVIYTNATTDPYSDATAGTDGAWNLELQSTLTNVIGNGAYDIGHLFGVSGGVSGGGNAGCIGCVCVNPSVSDEYGKGSAFTAPSNGEPEGDTFDIDFVAHEMGHQLGANHTFSFEIEGTGVSVEPGSGSTIMGYAGVSQGYDVQSNSDDYFAYASIKQIQDNLSTKTCPVSTILTNSTPTISAGVNYTIPKGTAFVLTGTGSDPNGDALTYCWEQNDTAVNKLSPPPIIREDGEFSLALPTKINGPNFRSFLPSSTPVRYMPALNRVLAGQLSSTWESVSTVARALNFTLTGRDNATLGSGQTNTDAMVVTVSGTVGPFAVTSQNTDDNSWIQGTSQAVTWSVNSTGTLQGSTNVNIKLSTDGGLTFSTVLAANTPNDGAETITVPNVTAKNCRILIEPTANIYYAVNSKPFAIGYTVTSSCNTYTFSAPFPIPESATFTTRTITAPASTGVVSDVNVGVGFTHSYLSDVLIEILSPQGTTVKLFEASCGDTDSSLLLNYDDLGDALSCDTTTLQAVAPTEPLSVFNDQNPEGVWTLRVRDAFDGDTGTLNSASITICTQTYALKTPDLMISGIILYSNPNKGNFNLKFTSDSTNTVKVIVHDLLGRKIFQNEYGIQQNFNENIQLKNAQPGVYLLTVVDGDRKEVKKFVVE